MDGVTGAGQQSQEDGTAVTCPVVRTGDSGGSSPVVQLSGPSPGVQLGTGTLTVSCCSPPTVLVPEDGMQELLRHISFPSTILHSWRPAGTTHHPPVDQVLSTTS